MSENIFDLEAVRDLIVDKQPPAVIVADTNIVMDWPDFAKWGTPLDEVVFVLPAIINVELARIKRRNKDTKGLDPASKAVRAYRDLCKKGAIHRGIHIGGVGWFVSVPIPMEDRMIPALKQWGIAAQGFGSSDLMFLLLTVELAQLSIAPVVLATTDSGLFGFASGNGVLAHYFEGFPMNNLGATLAKLPRPAGIDFKQLMSDIRQEAEKKKTIEVALVLTSKREIPRSFGRDFEQWLEDSPLPESPLLFAEGVGTLDRDMPFSWALSYSEWDYPFLCPSADNEFDPRPEFFTQVHLNFGGREDEVPSNVRQALEETLEMLTFPLAGWLGMPTILSPESIIKFFLYNTYVEESLSSKGGAEDDVKSEFAEEYRAASDLADFGAGIIFMRLGLDPQQSKVGDSLKKLLVALTASWGIGDRITIQVAV
jgi:hypothetical protein